MRKMSHYSIAIVSTLDGPSMVYFFDPDLVDVEDFLITESLAYIQASKKRYKCFKLYKKGLLKEMNPISLN